MIDIPQIAEKSVLDFNAGLIHEKALIDINRKYDRPPLAISIGIDDKPYKGEYYPLRFGTLGNISLIKGEEKSRKTFLKSLILAGAIGGRANTFTQGFEIVGHNIKDKWILDIDTEQDEYDSWLNAKRVPEMVGTVPENYKCFSLRQWNCNERRQFVEWIFMESDYRNNLGVVSIDGYVDLIKDFNSNIESMELTEDLMKWSSIAKCHITGILHLNPGAEKARGHLGTVLQQKCETVVTIKSDPNGEFSSVRCKQSRGKKFKDFDLSVDENWMPNASLSEEGFPL